MSTMTLFQCPNCPESIIALGTEAWHECPKTIDKRTKKFGKLVQFDGLPIVTPVAPEVRGESIDTVYGTLYEDGAGYAYQIDPKDENIVNVFNSWSEMLAAL